jgi:hypothetical protein
LNQLALHSSKTLFGHKKGGFCAQVAPKFTHRPKFWAMGSKPKSCSDLGATKRNSALRKTAEKFSAQVRLLNAEENSK